MTRTFEIPAFESYGDYSSDNYGAHTLVFTDHRMRRFYFSYRTLVAVYFPSNGWLVRRNVWGTTTGKHLNWIDRGNKADRVDSEEFESTLAAWID